jgi:SHS2 domain-containing protein
VNKRQRWEHFSHEADIGVRGIGPTIEAAFTMGALALTSVIADLDNIKPLHEVSIHCTAPDLDLLFVDWLNAIIYEMDTRNMLFSQFEVKIHKFKLQAMIKGETINRSRHLPVVDVKGATYTELKVYQKDDVWLAQCVVDV